MSNTYQFTLVLENSVVITGNNGTNHHFPPGSKLVIRTIANIRGKNKGKFAVSTPLGKNFAHFSRDEIRKIEPYVIRFLKEIS